MNRSELLALSRRKPIPPFALDERLTFYCPQENVQALQVPVVRSYHDFLRREYEPPHLGPGAVLLILPCTKAKPYLLSREHLAINTFLLRMGFRPTSPDRHPKELEAALPEGVSPELLNNTPWGREGQAIHRAVISEPMAFVPYELLYYFRGEPSPASRYDDPGLFEHRGSVCPWREDFTGVQREDGTWGWGPNEKHAYVEVHNYLSELLAGVLLRIRGHYSRILAYVSPRLTHRSFLTSEAEKRDQGLPLARRTSFGQEKLIGVNDRVPGLVEVIPSAADLLAILRLLQKRMPPGRARAHFATGGGVATALVLPETLNVLRRHLRR